MAQINNFDHWKTQDGLDPYRTASCECTAENMPVKKKIECIPPPVYTSVSPILVMGSCFLLGRTEIGPLIYGRITVQRRTKEGQVCNQTHLELIRMPIAMGDKMKYTKPLHRYSCAATKYQSARACLGTEATANLMKALRCSKVGYVNMTTSDGIVRGQVKRR